MQMELSETITRKCELLQSPAFGQMCTYVGRWRTRERAELSGVR